MSGEEFRHAGHQLVDTIANLLDHMRSLPVAHKLEPRDVRAHLPALLPSEGGAASDLLGRAASVLIENSTFTRNSSATSTAALRPSASSLISWRAR